MRDRSIVGEVFFVEIVFLEKRIDRTRFEVIRKVTRDERKVYDVRNEVIIIIASYYSSINHKVYACNGNGISKINTGAHLSSNFEFSILWSCRA